MEPSHHSLPNLLYDMAYRGYNELAKPKIQDTNFGQGGPTYWHMLKPINLQGNCLASDCVATQNNHFVVIPLEGHSFRWNKYQIQDNSFHWDKDQISGDPVIFLKCPACQRTTAIAIKTLLVKSCTYTLTSQWDSYSHNYWPWPIKTEIFETKKFHPHVLSQYSLLDVTINQ